MNRTGHEKPFSEYTESDWDCWVDLLKKRWINKTQYKKPTHFKFQDLGLVTLYFALLTI